MLFWTFLFIKHVLEILLQQWTELPHLFFNVS